MPVFMSIFPGYYEGKDELRSLNEITICEIPGKMAVAVDIDPNRNYGNQAYIKVYNTSNTGDKNAKLARVNIVKPGYQHHYKDSGKEWRLNSKEKKMLTNLLSQPNEDDESLTNWEVIISKYNNETRNYIDPDTPIPDFREY